MIIKNLGPIKAATINLNQFTILIGNNGTGKTLAAYSLFAFRNWLEKSFAPNFLTNQEIDAFIDNGKIDRPANEYVEKIVAQI